MKTSIATLAILGVAEARTKGHRPTGGLNAQNNRFNSFQNRFGRHITSESEYEERLGRFNANAAWIDATNEANANKGPDALKVAVNQFADMSRLEFQNWLGLAPGMESRAVGWGRNSGGMDGRRRNNGRHLSHTATTVDHHAAGHMYAVKNQGGCGSCWAFAANSALEGTVAAKTGAAPVRLSEQQLVDCTLRDTQRNIDLFGKDYGLWGCGGGWMSIAWDFQREQGIMLDADYPYTSGNTGTETSCAHDTTKVIGKVGEYRQIRGSDPAD